MNQFDESFKEYINKLDSKKRDSLVNEMKKSIDPAMLRDIATAANSGNMEEAKQGAQKLLNSKNGRDLASMIQGMLGGK